MIDERMEERKWIYHVTITATAINVSTIEDGILF